MKRFSLQDFLSEFGTEEQCLTYIMGLKYPDFTTTGCVPCTKCDRTVRMNKVKNRPSYQCNAGHQLHPLVGTIFERTTTPLTSWFYAFFVMTSTRSGISARQLQRELGTTYKTAWRILKQIRLLMDQGGDSLLSGTVEIDETYVGGKNRNRRYRKFYKPKEVVMGMVERDGRARLVHLPDARKESLIPQIQKQIDPAARIITDEWPAYRLLAEEHGYNHDIIVHKKTYVDGDLYTNNVENVWSHLKRGIKGVYRVVSPKYLQQYANEFAWRYNQRKSERPMFYQLTERISDRAPK